MKFIAPFFLGAATFLSSASAAPASTLLKRDTAAQILGPINDQIQAALSVGDVAGVISIIQSVTPLSVPSSIATAASAIARIIGSDADLFQFLALIQQQGLSTLAVDQVMTPNTGIFVNANSTTNSNGNPPTAVYPKSGNDPKFTLSESVLRGAIHIPSGFTYGAKPPVLLLPATGYDSFLAFGTNLIPMLTNADYADVVWLNVPGKMLSDAQLSGEHVAYAINYIASITKRKVTTVAWSQGNLANQWATKYFPSTRKSVSSHLALAADYDGFLLASALCSGSTPCAPAMKQQRYLADSAFITNLHNNNGDSAFVPTTTIYSSYIDQLVQPQSGTNASGYMPDVRNVGVANYDLQQVCPGSLAGSAYLHEGPLYNPLTIALIKDAVKNGGPARTSRIDLSTLCGQYVASPISLNQLLVTETLMLEASLRVLTWPDVTATEPALKSYAC